MAADRGRMTSSKIVAEEGFAQRLDDKKVRVETDVNYLGQLNALE